MRFGALLMLVAAVASQNTEETILPTVTLTQPPTVSSYHHLEFEESYLLPSQSVSMLLDFELRYTSSLQSNNRERDSIDTTNFLFDSQSMLLSSIQPTSTRSLIQTPLLLMPYSDSIEPSFTVIEMPIIRSISQSPQQIEETTEKVLLLLNPLTMSYESSVVNYFDVVSYSEMMSSSIITPYTTLIQGNTVSLTPDILLVTPIPSLALSQTPDLATIEPVFLMPSATVLDSTLFVNSDHSHNITVSQIPQSTSVTPLTHSTRLDLSLTMIGPTIETVTPSVVEQTTSTLLELNPISTPDLLPVMSSDEVSFYNETPVPLSSSMRLFPYHLPTVTIYRTQEGTFYSQTIPLPVSTVALLISPSPTQSLDSATSTLVEFLDGPHSTGVQLSLLSSPLTAILQETLLDSLLPTPASTVPQVTSSTPVLHRTQTIIMESQPFDHQTLDLQEFSSYLTSVIYETQVVMQHSIFTEIENPMTTQTPQMLSSPPIDVLYTMEPSSPSLPSQTTNIDLGTILYPASTLFSATDPSSQQSNSGVSSYHSMSSRVGSILPLTPDPNTTTQIPSSHYSLSTTSIYDSSTFSMSYTEAMNMSSRLVNIYLPSATVNSTSSVRYEFIANSSNMDDYMTNIQETTLGESSVPYITQTHVAQTNRVSAIDLLPSLGLTVVMTTSSLSQSTVTFPTPSPSAMFSSLLLQTEISYSSTISQKSETGSYDNPPLTNSPLFSSIATSRISSSLSEEETYYFIPTPSLPSSFNISLSKSTPSHTFSLNITPSGRTIPPAPSSVKVAITSFISQTTRVSAYDTSIIDLTSISPQQSLFLTTTNELLMVMSPPTTLNTLLATTLRSTVASQVVTKVLSISSIYDATRRMEATQTITTSSMTSFQEATTFSTETIISPTKSLEVETPTESSAYRTLETVTILPCPSADGYDNLETSLGEMTDIATSGIFTLYHTPINPAKTTEVDQKTLVLIRSSRTTLSAEMSPLSSLSILLPFSLEHTSFSTAPLKPEETTTIDKTLSTIRKSNPSTLLMSSPTDSGAPNQDTQSIADTVIVMQTSRLRVTDTAAFMKSSSLGEVISSSVSQQANYTTDAPVLTQTPVSSPTVTNFPKPIRTISELPSYTMGEVTPSIISELGNYPSLLTNDRSILAQTSIISSPAETNFPQPTINYEILSHSIDEGLFFSTQIQENTSPSPVPSQESTASSSRELPILLPTGVEIYTPVSSEGLVVTETLYEPSDISTSISQPLTLYVLDPTKTPSLLGPEPTETLIYTTQEFEGLLPITSHLLYPYQSDFTLSLSLSHHAQSSLLVTQQMTLFGREHFNTPSTSMAYESVSFDPLSIATELFQPLSSGFLAPDINVRTIHFTSTLISSYILPTSTFPDGFVISTAVSEDYLHPSPFTFSSLAIEPTSGTSKFLSTISLDTEGLIITPTTTSSEQSSMPNISVTYLSETNTSSFATIFSTLQSNQPLESQTASLFPTPSQQNLSLSTEIQPSSLEQPRTLLSTSELFISASFPNTNTMKQFSTNIQTAAASALDLITSELESSSMVTQSITESSVSVDSTNLSYSLILDTHTTFESRIPLTSSTIVPSPSLTKTDTFSSVMLPSVTTIQPTILSSLSEVTESSVGHSIGTHLPDQETLITNMDSSSMSFSSPGSTSPSTGVLPAEMSLLLSISSLLLSTVSSHTVHPTPSTCNPYSSFAVLSSSIVSLVLAIPPSDVSMIVQKGSPERCALLNGLVVVFEVGLGIDGEVEVVKRGRVLERQRKSSQKRQIEEYTAVITGIEDASEIGDNLVNVMFSILETSDTTRPQQVNSLAVSEAFLSANVHEISGYTIVRIAQPAQVTESPPPVGVESDQSYRSTVGLVMGAAVLVTLVLIIVLLVLMIGIWRFRHRKKFTLQVHPITNQSSFLSQTLIPTNSFVYGSRPNSRIEGLRSQLQGISVPPHHSEEEAIDSSHISHTTSQSRSITTLTHLAHEERHHHEEEAGSRQGSTEVITTLSHLVHQHSCEMLQEGTSSPENDNGITAVGTFETITHYDSPHLVRRPFPRLPPLTPQKKAPPIIPLPQTDLPQISEEKQVLPDQSVTPSPSPTDTFHRIPTPDTSVQAKTGDDPVDLTPKRKDQSRKRKRRRKRKQQKEEPHEPVIDTNEYDTTGLMEGTVPLQPTMNEDEQELWLRRRATTEYHRYISGEESSFHPPFLSYHHQLPPIGTPTMSPPFVFMPSPTHTVAAEQQTPGFVPEEDVNQSSSSITVVEEEVESDSDSTPSESEKSELLAGQQLEKPIDSGRSTPHVDHGKDEERTTKETSKWYKPPPHVIRRNKVAPLTSKTSYISHTPINMANLAWMDTINGPQLLNVMPLPLHTHQQLNTPQYVLPVSSAHHRTPRSYSQSLTPRPHSNSHSQSHHSQIATTSSSLSQPPPKPQYVHEVSTSTNRNDDPGVHLSKSETDFFDGTEDVRDGDSREGNHTRTQSVDVDINRRGAEIKDVAVTPATTNDLQEMALAETKESKLQRMIREAFGSSTCDELDHNSRVVNEQRKTSVVSAPHPQLLPATPFHVQPVVYAAPQFVFPSSPTPMPMRSPHLNHPFYAGHSSLHHYNPMFPGHFVPLDISTPQLRIQRPRDH